MNSVVRIDSDGLPQDIVISLEDGSKLDNVTNVAVYIDTRDVTRATLELLAPAVHLVAIGEATWTCPLCSNIIEHRCER